MRKQLLFWGPLVGIFFCGAPALASNLDTALQDFSASLTTLTTNLTPKPGNLNFALQQFAASLKLLAPSLSGKLSTGLRKPEPKLPKKPGLDTLPQAPEPPDFSDLGDFGQVETRQRIDVDAESSFTIDFPMLGSVVLKSFKRGESVVLQANFPEKGKNFDLGFIVVDDGVFEWVDERISFTGHLKFFNLLEALGAEPLEARFGLRNIEFADVKDTKGQHKLIVKNCTLGIKFIKGNKLELIPGNDATALTFDTADMVIEGSVVGLKIAGTMFTQKVSLAGEIDGKKLKAAKTAQERFAAVQLAGRIEKRKITEIIDELKAPLANTPFDNLSLEGSLVLNSAEGLVISGGLVGYEKESAALSWNGIELREAKAKLSTKEKRAYIYGKSDLLGLPVIAEFAIAWGTPTPSPTTQGAAPKAPTKAAAPDRGTQGVSFRVYLDDKDKKITEWRPLEKLPIPLPDDIKKKLVIHEPKAAIEASYLTRLAPPNATDKPPLSAATSQPQEGFVCNAFISGKGKLFEFEGELIIKVAISPKTGPRATLVFSLPEGLNLSKLLTKLGIPIPAPHTPQKPEDLLLGALDLISLHSTKFVLSTGKEKIGDWDIEPGINCQGGLTLSGDTEKNPVLFYLRDVLKKTQETEGAGSNKLLSVTFDFVFDPTKPRGMIGRAKLGTGSYQLVLPGVSDEKELDRNLPPNKKKYRQSYVFEKANMALVFTGEPAIGFGGNFTMTPPEHDDRLKFGLDLLFSPVGFKITGGMKGEWFEPLGLPLMSIGNVGINIGQTWEAIAAAATVVGAVDLLIPGQLGIAGCVTVGNNPKKLKCSAPYESPESKEIRDNDRLMSGEIALNVGKDVTSLAFLLDIKNPTSLLYTIDSIIALTMDRLNKGLLPASFQIPKIPTISSDFAKIIEKNLPRIRHARIKFAPLGANIWDISIPAGIGGAIYLDLPGKQSPTPQAPAREEKPLPAPESKTLLFARPGEEQWDVKVAPCVMGGPVSVPGVPAPAQSKEKDACGVEGGVCGTSDICGDLNIGLDGLVVKGKIPKIVWPENVAEPIFSITSADGKSDPCINIALTKNEQAFVINGRVTILHLLKTTTNIKLNKDGFAFCSASYLGPKGAEIGGKIYVTGLNFTLKEVAKFFRPDNLKNIKIKIALKDELTQKLMKGMELDIINNTNQYKREMDDLIMQMVRSTSQEDIVKVQNRANAICGTCCDKIHWTGRIFNKCCYDCWGERIKLELLRTKKSFEGTKLGQWVNDNIVRKLGLDKAAADVLGFARDVGIFAGKAAADVAKKLQTLFIIHSINGETNLEEFSKTFKIKGVTVVATVSGQTVCRTYPDYNVLDPVGGIQTLVKEMNKLIMDLVKAAMGQPIEATSGGCVIPDLSKPAPSVDAECQGEEEPGKAKPAPDKSGTISPGQAKPPQSDPVLIDGLTPDEFRKKYPGFMQAQPPAKT